MDPLGLKKFQAPFKPQTLYVNNNNNVNVFATKSKPHSQHDLHLLENLAPLSPQDGGDSANSAHSASSAGSIAAAEIIQPSSSDFNQTENVLPSPVLQQVRIVLLSPEDIQLALNIPIADNTRFSPEDIQLTLNSSIPDNIQLPPENIQLPLNSTIADNIQLSAGDIQLALDSRIAVNIQVAGTDGIDVGPENHGRIAEAAEVDPVVYQSTSRNKKYVCDLCGAKFFKPNKLNEHKLGHDGVSCKYCGQVFHAYSSLRFHMDSKHSSKTFTCETCGMELSGKEPLRKHKKSNGCKKEVAREKNFFCPVCGQGYKTKKSLMKHQKKHPESDSESD